MKKSSKSSGFSVNPSKILQMTNASKMMMMTSSGEEGGVKFKKLKIKQQKVITKDHNTVDDSSTIHDKHSLLNSLSIDAEGGSAEFTSKDHLLSSLLYGVKQSVMTSQDPLPPFLVPDHFKSSVKFSVKFPSSFAPSITYPITINTDVDSEEDNSLVIQVPLSLPNVIKIKEYAPLVFATLRDKVYSFNSRTKFINSLFNSTEGPPFVLNSFFKQLFSQQHYVQHKHHKEHHLKESSSGSTSEVMYSSSDHQVIIKIIEGSDVESLMSLLKSLHPFLVQRKSVESVFPASLLPQYLACFRLSQNPSVTSSVAAKSSSSSSDSSNLYVLFQRNPLSSSETFFPIHKYYSLTSDGIKLIGSSKETSSSSNESQLKLRIKREDSERLLAALESDLKFLSGHLLVGYSLLIGVHSIDVWETEINEEAEEEDDHESLMTSISQQLKKSLSMKQHQSEDHRKESLSLVIDPSLHPFAIPSPFVSIDSRSSSRPSLSQESTTSLNQQVQESSSSRFVYFIGFSDLIPLSPSFSVKELNLEKESKESGKKSEKKSKSIIEVEQSSSAMEAKETTSKEEMGKKEAAREYSRNLLIHFRNLLHVVDQHQGSTPAL